MKCQYCEKPATFHITELTGDEPSELHFCEEHARVYLTQSDEPQETTSSLAGVLAQQLKVGQTAEDLARLDQRACPMCGVTFYEFRHAGRLGCPHDYVCFREELEPLIMNIHGATEHVGKRPKQGVPGTDQPDATDPVAAGDERSGRAGRLRTGIQAAGRDPSSSRSSVASDV